MGIIKKRISANGNIEEIHKVVVYCFKVDDIDDPDIHAAEPLLQWQQSEQGQFIMANAEDIPIWHKRMNVALYGYDYAIVAELESKKLSEFYLRWGNPNGNN